MKTQLVIFTVLIFLISCGNPIQDKKNAERFFEDKNYEKSLLEINKVIDAEPDSISHYAFRVMIYDLMGKYKEEISDLNKIIELNKDKNSKSLHAHHQRAVAQIQLGLYNEALLDIDYFIENRDTVENLAEAYLNKASILYKLNDFQKAREFYTLTIKENNGKEKAIESQALVGLANLSKSSKESLNLLNKAIEIDDKSAIAYGARAALYMDDLGKADKAYNDSKKAISLNPNDATIYFNMGQLFLNYLNKPDSAVLYFEKAIRVSPQSPINDGVYMNLGCIKHRAGKLDSALVDFQKAETFNSKNDLLMYNFALLLSDLTKNKEALQKINNAISVNPNDADYFDTKGTILANLNSFKEAEIAYKNAIKLNPKFGGYSYNLGYLYGEENNHEQSIKYYDKAVQLNYDLEATLVNRALQKMKINKTSDACVDLKRAYKLGRTDIKPLIDKRCN